MSQNTSHAVMAQRVEAHDSLDDFPTQPWATRALCEWLCLSMELQALEAWEPAANRGHMVAPLREYFRSVHASDIHDYGLPSCEIVDFLWPSDRRGSWIITNPPFRLAEQFILTSLDRASSGVAVIVRTSFLESVGRYKNIFSVSPPTDILQFTERVPMVKGRLTATGSTATSYCWLVWRRSRFGFNTTEFHWIEPCRKRLERASDYPADATKEGDPS